jgi:hypothetical protein
MEKYKIANITFILALLISFSNTLFSQIVTDRPDQTESSSTVGKGNLQFESGFLIGFDDDGIAVNRQMLLPTTLLRYGLTNGIELRLTNQLESFKASYINVLGFSDMELGAKIELFGKENSNTEIAFLTHVVLPTGTIGLRSDKVGSVNKLAISHELNDNVSVGYNLGYNYFGDKNGDLTFSLALGIGLNDRVGVYIEPYGELLNIEEFVLNFDTGFTYLLKDNFQLDFSFGSGINQRMNYVSVGFSWLMLANN